MIKDGVYVPCIHSCMNLTAVHLINFVVYMYAPSDTLTGGLCDCFINAQIISVYYYGK